MITRLWQGWTSEADADRYEELIRGTVFPGILARRIDGLTRLELCRRSLGHEVEFITIMWFENWAAVDAFAGPEREVSVVPPAARAVLSRFDERARHYELRVERLAGEVG